jgi:cell wall-associated NlpC family hydrolase
VQRTASANEYANEDTTRASIRARLVRAVRIAALLSAISLAATPALAQPIIQRAASDSIALTDRRGGFQIFGGSAAVVRDSLVKLAREQLGRRYVLGGTTPEKGFDCSGLIRYVLAKLDINVPRTAAQQEKVGQRVAKDTAELQPGDLVTFGRGSGASHIGIYVGDGRFIHASSAAGRVVESQLIRRPTRRIKPWREARRVLAGPDRAAVASASSTDG